MAHTKNSASTQKSNRRGAARREDILEAATELFAERGYRGSGILELAKRLNMTHVGILHHFGTKENLLKEVVARRDESHDQIFSVFVEDGPDSFGTNVLTTASVMEPEVLTRLATVLRAENLRPGDPLHEHFDLREQMVRTFLAGLIRSGQERGEYRSDVDPEMKAVEILAFTIGMETQWLLNPKVIDVEKVYASFRDALIEDLTRGMAKS
jgi:AcrR family transcriptional regulator